MTLFARSRHHEKLALALDFRNAHTAAPVWCEALEKGLGQKRHTWESQIRVERAGWHVAAPSFDYDPAKACYTLHSKDGRCVFHLLSNKLRFSVCFPVLYKSAER